MIAEAAAGTWFADPAGRVGYELAVLLIVSTAGLDYDALARWVAIGYDHGRAALGLPHPHSSPAVSPNDLSRMNPRWPRRHLAHATSGTDG